MGGPGHLGWPLFARWVWCVPAIVCQGNTLENCHLCQLEEGERWLMWWFSFPWIFDDRPIMDFYMRDKWQDNKRYHIPCQSPNCHALILSLTLPLPTWSVVPLCPEHHHHHHWHAATTVGGSWKVIGILVLKVFNDCGTTTTTLKGEFTIKVKIWHGKILPQLQIKIWPDRPSNNFRTWRTLSLQNNSL